MRSDWMTGWSWGKGLSVRVSVCGLLVVLTCGAANSQRPVAQKSNVWRDPAEPAAGAPKPKIIARPSGAVVRTSVDEKSMRALIDSLVTCGTRLSIASWDDPKRGPGCGRDKIVARFHEISQATGGKLEVVVDKFDATSARTHDKPAHMENVYAILPGTDPTLAKTVFLVSGHFDSIPSVSSMMDESLEAPGADDDASGVSVSVESARLLSKLAASGKKFRATLLFAAVSGEEQG